MISVKTETENVSQTILRMKLPVDEKDTKLEFEMSELYEGVCGLSGCGGLPASIADATFYYDESGNAHRVVVQDGKDLNLKKEDRIFVLGGVLAKHGITSDELRTAMGKDSAAEIKSAKLLHGDFSQVLRKENTNRILKLILDKEWLVHFHMVQPLYFAYVDIVDSLEFDAANHIGLKDALYRALEDEFDQTLALFKRAKYPRVKPSDRDMFLNGVLEIVRHYVAAHGETPWTRLLSEKLSAKLEDKGGADGLPFLEGNDLTPHSWIDCYVHFYQTPLYSWPYNDHVLDREDTIEKVFNKIRFTFGGNPWERWRMVDSDDEPMVQVSDCIVSIVRKYFLFIEMDEDEVIKTIEAFDEYQMANLKLLNLILGLSSTASNRLHIQICCGSLAEKMRRIVRAYVPESDDEYADLLKCRPTE